MHIAHRVTNTYPSSVQSTRFSGSSTATRWLTSSHWWGDTLWLQACYKVKSIYSLELMKKECFTYFSYNALLSLWFKIFPFTWEHFPVSFKLFKEHHSFKVFNKCRAKEPYLLRPLENYHYCKQGLQIGIYWKLFLQKQGGTRTN